MEINSNYLPAPSQTDGTYLRIISLNDVYDLHNYARVKTLIDELKKSSGDSVLISTLNGDFLSPSLMTSLDGGQSILETLGLVGIDYACFGNHEFDVGLEVLQDRIKAFTGKWLNSNITSPQFVGKNGQSLPEYDILKVGNRSVVLGGFCTNDTDIFRPGALPTIERIPDAIEKIWAKCGSTVDLIVPLTHQTIAEDRALAVHLATKPELKNKVPVILGGHEHEIYIEDSGHSLIVKGGADAHQVPVIDLWWNADGGVHRAIHLLPILQNGEEATIKKFVTKKEQLIQSMLDVEMFRVTQAMSSKRTRFQPEEVASTLCSYIKKSLSDVDIVLLQGGCIRGQSDYAAGNPFTYRDLLNELPFGTEIAVIEVPGEVIQKAIQITRSTPEYEAPHYLHADRDTIFKQDSGNLIESINGKPFNPEHLYTMGIYQVLLAGMNDIEPLVAYVNNGGEVPPAEQCLPAKNLIVEACMKDAWRNLVSFEEWDADGDHQISKAELKAAVSKAFTLLDHDQDGRISKAELRATLLKKDGAASANMVSMMFDILDVDNDGLVSMEELASLAM